MQRDSGTYCDEPEDEKDFATWVADFNLDDRYGFNSVVLNFIL
jgi:hypothetical protein